ARKRGAETPVRLVSSAKSWLSHAAASRTAPILPWGAPDDVPKISPVTASAEYLLHLRRAWDSRFAAGEPSRALDRQLIFLTVPASFDEDARELTLRAANAAGFTNVTLLEEPQAACYAWIDVTGDAWRRQLRVGDLVLACDIGGGTTDFSLILVAEHDGDLALERVAIGDHILLGGDNMDLALARRRAAGLQELGLPYAADAAVTRHLARFLRQQAADAPSSAGIRRGPSGLACPTHVLFNGGVMKAAALRSRIVEVLNRWLSQEGFAPLDPAHVLDAPDLDHAVARGAAYYGRVRASGRDRKSVVEGRVVDRGSPIAW